MVIIGLTGGIGTGKSTALSYLESLGARVWDADAAARAVVEPGQQGWEAIRREFGAEYIDAAGNLLRQKLADRVFRNKEDRAKLNALLHPAIIGGMLRWLDGCRAEGAEIAVVDVPLLFESGVDQYVDEAWVLSCGVDEQVRRAVARGMDRGEAVRRVEAQMSDRERRRRARRVIDTSGPVQDTQRQLKSLFEEILAGE